MPKYSIITGFLGQTKDRFHVYNQPRSLEEKLAVVARIPGYSGVELVYPYEVPEPGELSGLLEKHGLALSAINVNIKGEPEFVAGSISSPRKEIREKAIRFIKEAKDYAVGVRAPRVTCCPLGDGFEFPFQTDYRATWTRLCDGFGEAASYKSQMPLFLEYKPKETRRQSFLNRAADTLCLIRDIAEPSLGITIDYGHSVYAGESPAETLCMLEASDYDYYIHINDNDKSWDWDYFCGSHTLLEYIEFLYYLKRFGYDDYLTTDTHPTRWDMEEMLAVNTRLTEKLWKLLDSVGMEEIAARVDAEDYMKTWRFIEENIFSLK